MDCVLVILFMLKLEKIKSAYTTIPKGNIKQATIFTHSHAHMCLGKRERGCDWMKLNVWLNF